VIPEPSFGTIRDLYPRSAPYFEVLDYQVGKAEIGRDAQVCCIARLRPRTPPAQWSTSLHQYPGKVALPAI
jgi:hypothetical protein